MNTQVEQRNLEEHGTTAFVLTPSSIMGAAREDLKRFERNNDGTRDGEYEQYAFHRKHVRKATFAGDILRSALAEPEIGRQSGKRSTRLLYSDPDLLKRALDEVV